MRRRLFNTIRYAAVIIPFYFLAADAGWEFVLKDEGFKIYQRKIEGQPFIQVKGTGTIHEPISKILSIVLDYKRIKEWQPNLETFERLETYSDRHFMNYFAMNLPWPVTDRDVVMRHKIKVDSKNRWVHISLANSTHPKRPNRKGYIRLPFARGRISMHWVDGGKATWMEFHNQGDPGGWIPAWLVNWISKKQIAGSISLLKKRVNSVKGNYENGVVKEVMAWK